ncbi:MAG: hypothetical protein HYV09_05860 [Deltaproteobacteria bacterium]|nr:hypothetical protein [Deltaproteobacteria bacterium]
MRTHAAFVLALISVGCSPATTPVTPPAPKPPPPPAVKVKPAESPARWVLSPNAGTTVDARLEIEGVGTLYVGRSGDRWLEKKGGGLVPADTLLAEPIAGVLRDGGRYAFVGAKGTVYFSKEPLGAVVETRASKSPLRSVAVGKRAIVAIGDGVLVRSTDLGATWAPANAPKIAGSLLRVAMLGDEGLALFAPQRVLATEDDGQTWTAVATPGVGARRVVADANGDVVLEGLTGSAVLRRSPLRLEKVKRAPTAGWDLPVPDTKASLLGSDAVLSGAAAVVGDRWVEAVQDPDQPDRWRLAIAELGKPPVLKTVPEIERCDRVFVSGQGDTLVVACTNPMSAAPMPPKSKWGMSPSYNTQQVKLSKSTDFGKTFKDDGTAIGSERDKLMWLSPEGVLIVDGACKRTRSDWECSESPPVVRPPGAKAFAKAVSAPGVRFDRVVFPGGTHAFAVGSDAGARTALFVSNNGGRDFTRRPLPPALDEKGDSHLPSGAGAIGADETGVFVIVRSDHGRLLRYAAGPDGSGLKGQLVPGDFDAFDLAGRRGFAVGPDGAGHETADGGATWTKVAAPNPGTSVAPDRLLACSAYGCLLGDHATRVGWDVPLGAAGKDAAPVATKKPSHRTPLRCTAEGEWKPLPGTSAPSTSNADLGGPSRWILSKRDPQKGALAAVVGTVGPKGLETKEIPLFAPGPVDTAGHVLMQIEGVAALRYSFKRDKAATPPPTMLPPPKYPSPSGAKPSKPYYPSIYSKVPPITPKQLVDVEVAWYVAATGKVHRGTIKAAGALDPTRDVADGRELPSAARTALLSIAAGGVHVRPFMSAGADAPLFFVSDAGKVEKLSWPELPTKDVRGRNIPLRVDAARVGGRSVVFGDVGGGLQLFLAWASANGQTWDSRAWGLWPELDEPRDAFLRFVNSSDKPILGVLVGATKEAPSLAWSMALEGVQADPTVIGPLPTQKSVSDPPKACGKDAGPWRMLVPWQAGTRHPVTVSLDGRDISLATSSQIVRTGPSGEGCVSALDAQVISGGGIKSSNDWYSAIVSPDDLGHASLFRSAYKPGTPGTEISVRTMTCAFTPGPLPELFANVPGFAE